MYQSASPFAPFVQRYKERALRLALCSSHSVGLEPRTLYSVDRRTLRKFFYPWVLVCLAPAEIKVAGPASTHLELSAKRNDAHLVRPDDGLARQLDALVRPHPRHAVREQQQDKAPVEQVDAEQVGHECQLRIELEDLADGLRRRDGVRRAAVEPRARDPVVVVVQHRYRVPLAV